MTKARTRKAAKRRKKRKPKAKPQPIIGYKLLRADGGSLTSQYERVIYPVGEWVTVLGNGAYIAITGGVDAGGVGPILTPFECAERLKPQPPGVPQGVQCFRRVRRLAKAPPGFVFTGSLYLSGLTSPVGLTLPTSLGGGSLDLGGLTSPVGLTLPRSMDGGYLYLRESVRAELRARGEDV